MTPELRKDLERFGRVETDTVTWVPKWYNYWHCFTGNQERDAIISELSEKYPGYSFYKDRCINGNRIFRVINIYKNTEE